MSREIFFAVGDIAAHDGHVAGPFDPADAWTNANPDGWREQEITGPHGTVLHEGTYEECEQALLDFLECDAEDQGRYCYTHNNPVRT